MDLSLEAYLKQLGVELWPGVAFYLTDDKSRAEAAKWLRDFNNGYNRWVETRTVKNGFASLHG